MVVKYQNRSFSWTINKMGSEVEKIVAVHFWTIKDTLRQMWVFFRVVSFNGPLRFTSGSLYTSNDDIFRKKMNEVYKNEIQSDDEIK